MLKNWCFCTVVLEKTLESPLDCKKIKPANPRGNQSWIFIGRPDVEAETPILWLPDVKNILTGKDPDVPKDWRQEEKGTTKWDGWMASLTWWIWVWVSSRSWWLTGKPGMLQSMGSQRVRHNWVSTGQCLHIRIRIIATKPKWNKIKQNKPKLTKKKTKFGTVLNGLILQEKKRYYRFRSGKVWNIETILKNWEVKATTFKKLQLSEMSNSHFKNYETCKENVNCDLYSG